MIDPQDPETITAPDRAAIATYTFLGKPLAPFSIDRQYAAQALGNRLLCGTAELTEGGTYPGHVFDVVALLFLCASPESVSMLAMRKPDQVRAQAMAWAQENAISFGSAAMREASEIYAGILGDLQESQFDIIEDPKKNTPAHHVTETPPAGHTSNTSPS